MDEGITGANGRRAHVPGGSSSFFFSLVTDGRGRFLTDRSHPVVGSTIGRCQLKRPLTIDALVLPLSGTLGLFGCSGTLRFSNLERMVARFRGRHSRPYCDFIDDPNVLAIPGIYNRGASKHHATFFLHEPTRRVVVRDMSGNFETAYTATPGQVDSIKSFGTLGGG